MLFTLSAVAPRSAPTSRVPWLALGLLLAACSSGGDSVPVPAEDVTAPTAMVQGTWQVEVRITEATGSNCNPDAVGQTVSGSLSITQTGTSIRVTDEGGNTGSGSVTGNVMSFSASLLGATESWRVVIYDNDARLSGGIDVDAPSCEALATATGSRTSTQPATHASATVRNERTDVLRTVYLHRGDGTAPTEVAVLLPGDHFVVVLPNNASTVSFTDTPLGTNASAEPSTTGETLRGALRSIASALHSR